MKAMLIFVLYLLGVSIVYGQNTLNKDFGEIKVSPPKFVGFAPETDPDNKSYDASFNKYLEEQIHYPRLALERQLEGTEVVRFVVDAHGELKDFKVLNSVADVIDTEVIRAISATGGMWQPGTNNDERVAMEKEVSVTFKLGKDEAAFNEEFVELAAYFFRKGNKKFLTRENPRNAIKIYSAGLRYLPHDQSLLLMRGICHFALGNIDQAKEDWARLESVDGVDETFNFWASNLHLNAEFAELSPSFKH